MRTRIQRALAALALAVALVASGSGWAAVAHADEYDPQESGHPLRIVGYALHPIGVILDLLIFRPAHWIVEHEPLTTLFGHEDF